MGMSDVYEHYIDKRGYKFYTDHSLWGTMIKQVNTGSMICDCSSKLFDSVMLELGFSQGEHDLFFVWDNYDKFIYRVRESVNGKPNQPEKIGE